MPHTCGVIDHNAEPYADPQEYDRAVGDTGVAFYARRAQETGGPVLEIGCGTGRVAIPIARLGLSVTGLDIAPLMLEQARRKSAGLPVHWVEADGRAFSLGQRFRLIFLTGNTFQQFLSNADQGALLGRVHAHLENDGLLAFETRMPLWATPQNRTDLEAVLERARRRGDFFTLLESGEVQPLQQTYTDANGCEMHESLTQAYDPITQVLHLTSYRRWADASGERTKVTHELLRYTFPQELIALLNHNSFAVVRLYGDWNLEPLTATSTSIIVVARKLL